MTPFTFEVQRGRYAGGRCTDAVLADEAAAWRAAVHLCADLLQGIASDLTPEEPEWCLQVSDDSGRTLFQFRLVGERVPPGSRRG